MKERKPIIYIIAAFGWTWLCWLAAFFIGRQMGHDLVMDATIFDLFTRFTPGSGLFVQALFAAGVYGPLLGFLLARGSAPRVVPGNRQPGFWPLALLLPLVMILPTLILSLVITPRTGAALPVGAFISQVAIYFISNFLTSGTEEFGWRGFLFPVLRQEETSFWNASWKGGLIWALWHYPMMAILYMDQGLAVLLPTLVGFTAGIVAMNYITNFIYEKTASLPLVMGLHALNNTSSFAVLLAFPQSPFIFVSSIMAWAVVGFLDKKYRLE